MAPLLLLATPGRASPRPIGTRPDAARTVALTRRLTADGATGATARPTVRVELAADHSPPPGTTTTSSTSVVVTTPIAAPRLAPPSSTTTTTVTTTTTTTTTTLPPVTAHQELGVASWYDTRLGYCASPYLSFGTVVTVTDLATGQSIHCTVDDRQAVNPGRVVDLSYEGFAELAHPSIGLVEVSLTW